jgi:two-component system sensor histidine kinase PilS (NtrC family)
MSQDPAALPSGDAGAESPVYDPATVVRHIAHELRQPLSTVESIACYLEMVLPRTDTKARRQIAKLRQEIRQANWILSDALHFLRAAPLQLHLLDLTEVVSKCLSEWGAMEGADIRLKLEHDLPLVLLDPEQTQHLLRNIVAFFGRVSALRHTILLRTCAAGGEVIIEIVSQAPECSAADLDPLFKPFDSHRPGGSGLGLASVRRIADAHGARLQAGANPAGEISLVIAFPVGR